MLRGFDVKRSIYFTKFNIYMKLNHLLKMTHYTKIDNQRAHLRHDLLIYQFLLLSADFQRRSNVMYEQPHVVDAIQHVFHYQTSTNIQSFLQISTLKGNAAYLKKIVMDENDALSEYKKIPLGYNRTNSAVYSKIYFKVEICSAH